MKNYSWNMFALYFVNTQEGDLTGMLSEYAHYVY